jgi:CheY-like chemotaxis protein
MRSVFDDFMNVLASNRDYVLLALAIVVLTQAAILMLWARRSTTLRRRMEQAVAEAEQSAARLRAAAAAAAGTAEEPQTYRVADRRREEPATPGGVTIRDGETKLYAPPGRTTALAGPEPTPAPQEAAAPAPAASPADPALAAPPEEYVSPRAEQAAAWMLPEVEASRAAEAAPTPAAPETTTEPTTMGWAAASVPVEPAADFAVITDAQAVQALAPPARPAQPPANGGNGHTPAAAWPSGATTEPDGGWDAAMFGSNVPTGAETDPGRPGADILLVEDDPTIAKLYGVLLESRGYTVRRAGDGLDGLDQANQRRPDLVLLDIMMPRMNGIAFLQALRSGPMQDVPVVVLSNFMEQQLVDDAMSLGALEYMVKAQTRPEALVGALPHWLRGERAFSS